MLRARAYVLAVLLAGCYILARMCWPYSSRAGLCLARVRTAVLRVTVTTRVNAGHSERFGMIAVSTYLLLRKYLPSITKSGAIHQIRTSRESTSRGSQMAGCTFVARAGVLRAGARWPVLLSSLAREVSPIDTRHAERRCGASVRFEIGPLGRSVFV
jgi:hypothetical protein